jgi:hypothetical protein
MELFEASTFLVWAVTDAVVKTTTNANAIDFKFFIVLSLIICY